jgi:hypothetical protein
MDCGYSIAWVCDKKVLIETLFTILTQKMKWKLPLVNLNVRLMRSKI